MLSEMILKTIGELKKVDEYVRSEYASIEKAKDLAQKTKDEVVAAKDELVQEQEKLRLLNNEILRAKNLNEREASIAAREENIAIVEAENMKKYNSSISELKAKHRILDDKILGYEKEVRAIKDERKQAALKAESLKEVARAIVGK